MKAYFVICCMIIVSLQATADELMKDFDSLGGNDVLLEKTQALQGKSTTYVVQNRIVNRRGRVELSPEYSNVLGGDPYTATSQWGLNAHLHLNPRWSVGVKYSHMVNSLKAEGENLISDTSILGRAYIPDIDYPISQTMALVNWYPIYGKMNILDAGISHFDVYLVLGNGQIELKSGRTSTWTGGAGVGLWISQHLATRLELRYQSYEAQNYQGKQKMDLTVASVQTGYLF